jgi:hypothetical protein
LSCAFHDFLRAYSSSTGRITFTNWAFEFQSLNKTNSVSFSTKNCGCEMQKSSLTDWLPQTGADAEPHERHRSVSNTDCTQSGGHYADGRCEGDISVPGCNIKQISDAHHNCWHVPDGGHFSNAALESSTKGLEAREPDRKSSEVPIANCVLLAIIKCH